MLRTIGIALFGAMIVVLCMRYNNDSLVINDVPVAASAAELDDWRRTTHGWEKRSDWSPVENTVSANRATMLHPVVVAALVLLLSIGALIAQTSNFVGWCRSMLWHRINRP